MINAQFLDNQMTSASNTAARQPVVLVGTRTIDRIPTPGGIREAAGGPPTFVEPVLRAFGWQCLLVTGQTAVVDVIPRGEGEEVVISELPPIPLPAALTGAAIIFSPIMREIDIHRLPALEGLVVTDLQGFVRHPGAPSGHPDHDVDLLPLLRETQVVKGTPTELAALSAPSRLLLDHRILVLTRGRAGAQIVTGDEVVTIPAEPVSGVNTLGAGDTFLASFTAGLLDGATPAAAATAAARFTEAVLRRRRRR